MGETTNTAGLTVALRDAIYSALDCNDWVGCTSDIAEREAEMRDHFGAPQPAGYMSEASGWQLDADDAEAIRAAYD